jgi:RNA polymerase sigma-70 factor (sigma-E family)
MPEHQRAETSFDDFVADALPALLRFGHVLTGNPHDAEDLVQEALARSMRRWCRGRPNEPMAYVRKTMVNAHLTRWRRWGSRVQLGDVPEAAAEDKHLQRSTERDELRRALAALAPGQRAVLVLRYLEDLPDHEIAGLLGCRPATVRSQAMRGLAALRLLLTGPAAFTAESVIRRTGRPPATLLSAAAASVTSGGAAHGA